MNRTSLNALLFATMLMSAATEGNVGATGAEKTADQIAQEAAEAAAAKKAAADQAKAQKAEEAAKAKAAKKEAADAAKAAKAEAAAKEKAEKDAAKAAADEAKRLAAEQKAKEKAEKAATKVKVQLVSQNGETRPKDGTKTGSVWAIADKLSAEKGSAVAISELMPVATGAGLNDATIRTQYARWKEFYAIYGKVKTAAQAAAPAPAPTETPAVEGNEPEVAAA